MQGRVRLKEFIFTIAIISLVLCSYGVSFTDWISTEKSNILISSVFKVSIALSAIWSAILWMESSRQIKIELSDKDDDFLTTKKAKEIIEKINEGVSVGDRAAYMSFVAAGLSYIALQRGV